KEALMTWFGRSISAVAIAGGLAACGSSEVPAKQLADAEAGIRAAREVGAEDTPKAALQLKVARDGVDRAQKLSKDGEQERASAALEEAKLDAELAVLLAKQEKVEAQAAHAKQRAVGASQAKSVTEPESETPAEAMPSQPMLEEPQSLDK